MIIVALGANIPSEVGPPLQTLVAAVDAIRQWPDTYVLTQSSWYKTDPVGEVEQPEFINGVIILETNLLPIELLRQLLQLERSFGRERGERWGPRTLDLDVIAYGGLAAEIMTNDLRLDLPHPRLADRSFVLIPLMEVAPDWRHPLSGLSVRELLSARPNEEKAGICKIEGLQS